LQIEQSTDGASWQYPMKTKIQTGNLWKHGQDMGYMQPPMGPPPIPMVIWGADCHELYGKQLHPAILLFPIKHLIYQCKRESKEKYIREHRSREFEGAF
jgi:hypothetical protein